MVVLCVSKFFLQSVIMTSQRSLPRAHSELAEGLLPWPNTLMFQNFKKLYKHNLADKPTPNPPKKSCWLHCDHCSGTSTSWMSFLVRRGYQFILINSRSDLCCVSRTDSSLAWQSTAWRRFNAASKSGWLRSACSKQMTDLLYSAKT